MERKIATKKSISDELHYYNCNVNRLMQILLSLRLSNIKVTTALAGILSAERWPVD